MIRILKRPFAPWLVGLAMLMIFPPAGGAQESLDTRWLPWLGCWQAGVESQMQGLLVCVRPAAERSGIEVATVTDGEIASTRTLVADGQAHELKEEGCSGWQSATFSGDGRRAFLRSDLTCEGGVKRSASAIMALASPAEWLDVQAIGMDGEWIPRVVRYRPAPASGWPEAFRLPPHRVAAAGEARLLAPAYWSLSDVEEAAARVHHEALVAFLIERDQAFDLDARKLAALDEAGVPSDVIDVLVAVSYPNRFAIDRPGMRLAVKPDQQAKRRYAGRSIYLDPFGWGGYRYGYGSCYAGWSYWGLSCSAYGYGLGVGGYDSYWWGYPGQPVIAVKSEPRGQAVSGRGYTRGGAPSGGGSGRQAHDRTSRGADIAGSSASGSPSRGSSSSSGSASPSGYTQSSGSSTSSSSTPTAKPRCCN